MTSKKELVKFLLSYWIYFILWSKRQQDKYKKLKSLSTVKNHLISPKKITEGPVLLSVKFYVRHIKYLNIYIKY